MGLFHEFVDEPSVRILGVEVRTAAALQLVFTEHQVNPFGSGADVPLTCAGAAGLCIVQAGGEGVETKKHAATITKGRPGVLHGAYSYLLQDEDGQIIDPHSISAG